MRPRHTCSLHMTKKLPERIPFAKAEKARLVAAIDVASHRDTEPRGIRSGERLRYLPTVDGQIGPADFREAEPANALTGYRIPERAHPPT